METTTGKSGPDHNPGQGQGPHPAKAALGRAALKKTLFPAPSTAPGLSPTGAPDSEAPRFMDFGARRQAENRFFAREGVDPLTRAFDGKIAVHPGMGGEKPQEGEMPGLLDHLPRQERPGTSVVYVNVPFCETHCLYCGFYKNPYQPEASPAYVDTLEKELELWADKPIQQSGAIHAVYLGGGTPTALEPADLKRLLRALRARLPLANDCEITVEGRVSNLTPARIEACLEGGANRFSLGVQSFHSKIRQAMGRRSSREELLDKIALLQSYNQAAILVDLIYGLPMQGLKEWLEDIATAQALKLDGADCYQLNVYKGSKLARAIENGAFPAGADLPGQARMFEAGVKAMEGAFYRRLSISHWGRTPRERNLYNQYVKGSAHCLAFGPGAGGNLLGHFNFNEPELAVWRARVEAGEKPVAMLLKPKKHAELFRVIAEGLEQAHLDLPLLEERFALNLAGRLAPLLEQWERAGLLQKRGAAYALTLAGQFWQVNLAQLLLEYLNDSLKE